MQRAHHGAMLGVVGIVLAAGIAVGPPPATAGGAGTGGAGLGVAHAQLQVVQSDAGLAAGGPDQSHGGGRLVGMPAPPFILPRIGQEGEVASDTLFDAYGLTLLAFWTTHCAECTRRMEVCQELYDWGAPKGLQVIGINFDDHPSAKMRSIARSAGPRLMHLYDPGGRMASIYEAGSHSYSAFLVDARGVIRAVYYEIMPDELWDLRPTISGLLEEALTGEVFEIGEAAPGGTDSGREAEPTGAPDTGTISGRRPGEMPPFDRPGVRQDLGFIAQQKIELHGRGRLRWMHIDTTGTGAVGSNNEPLVPGPSLRHRMELELAYAITPRLKAGALIRISNEGEMVLRSGPDYLSNPWGSFFMRWDARARVPLLGQLESSLIGGYYRVHFTPLTLMRWDQDDTPISGGQRAQGCGVCGGEAGMAGFIRSESLEQLGPDLAFEGARWNLTFLDRFDLTALYARPQTPLPEDRSGCYTTDSDTTYFHQDLYAARLKMHVGMPWGSEPAEVAATGIFVNENEDLPGCPLGKEDIPPFQDAVLAGDVRVPFPGRTVVFAEGALCEWKNKCLGDADLCPSTQSGDALLAGVEREWRAGEGRLLGISTKGLMSRMELAYTRISADFLSAYSALSYETNFQGLRFSMRTDWGPVGVGLFYKSVKPIQEIAPPSFAEELDQRKRTASVWADAEVWRGGVLMAGAVFEDRDVYQGEDLGRLGPQSYGTLILSFDQEIAPQCSLLGEMEWLDGEYKEGVQEGTRLQEVTREYTSTVFRLMVDVEF